MELMGGNRRVGKLSGCLKTELLGVKHCLERQNHPEKVLKAQMVDITGCRIIVKSGDGLVQRRPGVKCCVHNTCVLFEI